MSDEIEVLENIYQNAKIEQEIIGNIVNRFKIEYELYSNIMQYNDDLKK